MSGGLTGDDRDAVNDVDRCGVDDGEEDEAGRFGNYGFVAQGNANCSHHHFIRGSCSSSRTSSSSSFKFTCYESYGDVRPSFGLYFSDVQGRCVANCDLKSDSSTGGYLRRGDSNYQKVIRTCSNDSKVIFRGSCGNQAARTSDKDTGFFCLDN